MKYYLMNNGAQQSGPFELNELLGNGLTPQSYVWNETMSNWLPAMQVPEVAAMLNTQHTAVPFHASKQCKRSGFYRCIGNLLQEICQIYRARTPLRILVVLSVVLYLDLVHLWFGSNCVIHTIHFRHLSSASRHRT